MRTFLRFGLPSALLAVSVLAGVTAEAQLFSMSKNEIKRAERLEWLSMKKHLSPEPDPRVRSYVQCIATALIGVLDGEAAALDWEVLVFDDDGINAAANSSGKVAVLNGLLRVADTPDSLAAVLGHEMAHATENHVIERARKGVRNDFLVMLGSAWSGIQQDLLADGAMILSALPYARDQETEADLMGLKLMAKAGFDPRAAIYLWKNMAAARAEDGKERVAEFLSSHPADDTRLDSIVKAITPALIDFNQARDSGHRPNCEVRQSR